MKFRREEYYKKPEGLEPECSFNANIFVKIRRNPDLWGNAWKYRAYYLSWMTRNPYIFSHQSRTTLKPRGTEVRRPGTTHNVQHLMCPKDMDVRPGKNIYLRTALARNWCGSRKYPGTHEGRKYPFFSHFMYEPLVESQFYFRWYAFASLMTTWSTALYPPQATLSLSEAAEKASHIEYHKRYNTIL